MAQKMKEAEITEQDSASEMEIKKLLPMDEESCLIDRMEKGSMQRNDSFDCEIKESRATVNRRQVGDEISQEKQDDVRQKLEVHREESDTKTTSKLLPRGVSCGPATTIIQQDNQCYERTTSEYTSSGASTLSNPAADVSSSSSVTISTEMIPPHGSELNKSGKEYRLNPGAKIFSPSFTKPIATTNPAVPTVASMGYMPTTSPVVPVAAAQPEVRLNPYPSRSSLPVKVGPYNNFTTRNGGSPQFSQPIVGHMSNSAQALRYAGQYPVQAGPSYVHPNSQAGKLVEVQKALNNDAMVTSTRGVLPSTLNRSEHGNTARANFCGSINLFMRMKGGVYNVFLDTLVTVPLGKGKQGAEHYQMAGHTCKCHVISGILLTAVGGIDRQKQIWDFVENEVKKLGVGVRQVDVLVIKSFVDEFYKQNPLTKENFALGVDMFVIGYSNIKKTCIPLHCGEDEKGPTLYEPFLSWDVQGSPRKFVTNQLNDMDFNSYFDENKEMESDDTAMKIFKKIFIKASLEKEDVGGRFELWRVSKTGVQKVPLSQTRVVDVAIRDRYPFAYDKQLLIFDHRSFRHSFVKEIMTAIQYCGRSSGTRIVPTHVQSLGAIGYGWQGFLVTFQSKLLTDSFWYQCCRKTPNHDKVPAGWQRRYFTHGKHKIIVTRASIEYLDKAAFTPGFIDGRAKCSFRKI